MEYFPFLLEVRVMFFSIPEQLYNVVHNGSHRAKVMIIKTLGTPDRSVWASGNIVATKLNENPGGLECSEGIFPQQGRNAELYWHCSCIPATAESVKWVTSPDIKSFVRFPLAVSQLRQRGERPPCPINKQHSVPTSSVLAHRAVTKAVCSAKTHGRPVNLYNHRDKLG